MTASDYPIGAEGHTVLTEALDTLAIRYSVGPKFLAPRRQRPSNGSALRSWHCAHPTTVVCGHFAS